MITCRCCGRPRMVVRLWPVSRAVSSVRNNGVELLGLWHAAGLSPL